ncbi:ABC transporter substrate-binding protein [Chromobacterium sp. ASV23]|uniref:ABC transporter substrate-binding protein n=1 Tax=Chromobacterium sp. ASV23 TaxID=2795110 RepID=UPI0018ED06F8|nr:extracellular solute-binding protein [Chromobacterium sp. ASV23]
MRLFALCLVLSGLLGQSAWAAELTAVVLSVNPQQYLAFHNAAQQFSAAHPAIKLTLRVVENEQYKRELPAMLSSATPPDVLFMFGGVALTDAVQKGQLAMLDRPGQVNDWQQHMPPALLRLVTVEGKPYGVPLSYYPWAIYYNKLALAKAGVAPPTTFAELLASCDRLRAAGVAPITIAAKDLWPLAGWFDYLDLRMNGLEFHQQLLQGKQSWLRPQLAQVFSAWQQLRDHHCYDSDSAALDWRASLPMLYNQRAGMMLMGSFWTGQLPSRKVNEIGMIAFPKIAAAESTYEEAPADVLVMTAKAAHRQEAEQFLRFFATPAVQAALASATGVLPARQDAPVANAPFLRQGRTLLNHASGFSQFFDRDSHAQFAARAMPILREFAYGQLSATEAQRKLEAERNRDYGPLSGKR